MKFFTFIIIGFLFFTVSPGYTERQNSNGISYEFTQVGNLFRFCGTFSISANPDCLLHILYDSEHLINFITHADSIISLGQGGDSYEVCYVYRKLLFESRFTYRKTLFQQEQRIAFEMVSNEQGFFSFPRVISSRGYYEIKPQAEGYTVVYFEEARIGSRLPRGLVSMAENEAIKFLEELKKYIELKCY